ncbi:toxic protein SymE [Pseudomonas flavescens]|uniref:Toxic protein SymE n=1 Tax=Phytopseudomonas flavescens TaxID=29435 RepID=A0A1G8M8C5_9GAMM|nr:SymE family type I addiction module toxin [Pseudomonas flavescens]SDI64135.1 toxic protein SymE [Pseudomonas flavescens]
MKNRKLKVRLGYYDLPATTERARSATYISNPKVPFILLKGYWLERANFLIDTPLDVCVQENRLIITVADANGIRDRPA